MNKQRIRILMLGTPAMIFGILASSASAVAQSAAVAQSDTEEPEQPLGQRASCSNRTLSGDYGGAGEGVLINIPGLPPEAPFRNVGLTHYDGKGGFTGVEHTVINGNYSGEADWTTNSGTYTVNPNCTGTMVLNTPGSPVPLNLFFVVVKQGREIHTVLSSSAISTVQIKVGESRSH